MIRALVLDVDGVLTDGGIVLDGGDGEWKRFHARDGVGVKLALLAGWRVVFCTARSSPPARRRAEELGAEWAIGVKDKVAYLDAWLAGFGIPWAETAYMGDDLQDLGALRKAGYPMAVADAAAEVRAAARYVTTVPGGAGAVREAVEHLLHEAGRHAEVLAAFVGEGFAVGEERSGGRS